MAAPFSMQMSVFKHILKNKLAGRKKFPLVMMLEPLFACNLECAGCGKIQYPPDILRKRLSPQECWDAVEECGAPVVSVAGGEPLIHPEIDKIIDGLIKRGKYVYLCSNALLLEKNLHRFKPSPHLIFSIHLDGVEKTHDRMVCKDGVFKTAVSAIRAAKAMGHYVMTNSTIFNGEDSEEFRKFFDFAMKDLGLDGMMISPGYAYEKAPAQELFLKQAETKSWFRETLKDWRKKGWAFNHSTFYMDFLEGKRDYECAPWGMPLRNVFGWQKPCYLIADGGYAKSYQELLDETDWSAYGKASGNPKCTNCMTHVGYETPAVMQGFSSPRNFIEMVVDFATVKGPKKVRGAQKVALLQHAAAEAEKNKQPVGTA